MTMSNWHVFHVLKSIPGNQRNSLSFNRWINSELKGFVCVGYDLTVSMRKATHWFLILGFNFEEYRQGSAHVHGHERLTEIGL